MKNKNIICRYVICFVLISVLCWFFPYSGDDWAWGSQIGIDRLQTWFKGYNGRYVGNLLVLALTRSNLLKTLVMSVCLTGIIFCFEKLLKQKWAYYIAIAMMALVPKFVFRQAVVWTSGFTNYVVSAFLTLIYITYVYSVFEKKGLKQKVLPCIPLLVLGVISSLIMEYVTIYNLVLAVAVIVYIIFTEKKIFVQHVSYLVGTVLGAVYMFSNEAYHAVVTGTDGYRTMGKGNMFQIMKDNYLNVIYEEFYLSNVWLNIALFIVSFLLYKELNKKYGGNVKVKIMNGCLWIMGTYLVWQVNSSIGLYTLPKEEMFSYAEGVATFLSVAALMVFAITVGVCKKCLWKMLFWVASIVCLVAPLLVVTPIGSRCFYITYLLFIGLLCEFCNLLDKESIKEVLRGKSLARGCTMVGIVTVCFYTFIFSSMQREEQNRLRYIRKEVKKGEKQIELKYLPYGSFVWAPTPEYEPWFERYKLFYDIPQDVQLTLVLEYSHILEQEQKEAEK